jgi:hypothetical protein
VPPWNVACTDLKTTGAACSGKVSPSRNSAIRQSMSFKQTRTAHKLHHFLCPGTPQFWGIGISSFSERLVLIADLLTAAIRE